MNTGAQPLIWTPAVANATARALCTDCGISRTAEPSFCAQACQFIAPDYASAERRIHGRTRDESRAQELYFGTYLSMHAAELTNPVPGAQWTGITTRIAQRLLEENWVDAVIAVAPHPKDQWRPLPVIVTEPADLLHCSGMRMGYAPTLAMIEPAIQRGYRRLAVIGIPCQIYALRELELKLRHEGKIDELYVIGTPCSDNTTTENFHLFLSKLTAEPDTVTYLEFCTDFHVELRFKGGETRRIPFLKLPLSELPDDFFPTTCKTCVDYTNCLADVTVGYMGGDSKQWLICRNKRGESMLTLIEHELTLSAPISRGRRASSVKGFIANTRLAAGGLPLRRMPNFMRTVMAWLMPRVGPRGLEFARARVEMKAAESILHLRNLHPKKMRYMIPAYIWSQVAKYELTPTENEIAPDSTISMSSTSNRQERQ